MSKLIKSHIFVARALELDLEAVAGSFLMFDKSAEMEFDTNVI